VLRCLFLSPAAGQSHVVGLFYSCSRSLLVSVTCLQQNVFSPCHVTCLQQQDNHGADACASDMRRRSPRASARHYRIYYTIYYSRTIMVQGLRLRHEAQIPPCIRATLHYLLHYLLRNLSANRLVTLCWAVVVCFLLNP
jgi:hypothetical protein